MIFGEIENPKLAGIDLTHPVWRRCWEWLEGYQPGRELGIEKFESDRFFSNLHAYDTRALQDCRWETHRHTIDLQVVLAGGEWIEILPESPLLEDGSYQLEKEVQKYHAADSSSRIHLVPGRFAVFFPGEPHRPQISDGVNTGVRKVVFKTHESMLTQSR